jgi:hypothetical protein
MLHRGIIDTSFFTIKKTVHSKRAKLGHGCPVGRAY